MDSIQTEDGRCYDVSTPQGAYEYLCQQEPDSHMRVKLAGVLYATSFAALNRCQALTLRIAKLREALEKIASAYSYDEEPWMVRVAKQALKGGE
jgi:hypothetical protein